MDTAIFYAFAFPRGNFTFSDLINKHVQEYIINKLYCHFSVVARVKSSDTGR